MNRPTLICVVGPTAIGKTALGIKLAQEFNADIISADSRQIYRHMAIGTAAPTEEEKAQAKHHFVEFLHPSEIYSAGDFEKDAISFLEDYFKDSTSESSKVAILVGGSGLYVKGVVEGFDNLPRDLALRKTLNQRLESEGLPALQAELKALDPEHYSRMDTSNPQRVVRALEVTLFTGKPFSEFHSKTSQQTENTSARPFDIIQIGLEAPREIINKRIEMRTQLMLDAGWLEETRALLPLRHHNSLNTVGYKELFAHLDGEMTLEQAKERIIISTRQFAKRQMTWFKKDPTITWFDFFEEKDGAHKILAHIHKFADHA